MVRLFAAVAIPDEIGMALMKRQKGVEGARWRPLDALHVTLRFFGDVREDLALDLDTELAEVSGRAFDMVLEGAGSFGDGADIHAVWAGIAENEHLKHLARSCELAARRAGLKAEHRHYRPHVTLAYTRHPDPVSVAGWVQAHNLLKSPPIRVESFGLYSSHATKEGSRYRLEAEYPLRP